MVLKQAGFIELPEHKKTGGFDHAAIHPVSRTLYVAHTSNDSVDVIDLAKNRYTHSISNLPGVAGVLVSNDLVFTSNREEETVGIIKHGRESDLEKVKVGGRPNGLAFDPTNGTLLAANVSKPAGVGAVTVSIVKVQSRIMVADVMVPGRTRWTVFDRDTNRFYVNIAQPSQVIFIDANDPDGILGNYAIPATGPHGLDLDRDKARLYCACDQGGLFMIELRTGKVSKVTDLAGPPDVIFHNPRLDHLYVTIGDPGVIQVFDTKSLKMIQTIKTEHGTHTIAFEQDKERVYAFMPETHQAGIYLDE